MVRDGGHLIRNPPLLSDLEGSSPYKSLPPNRILKGLIQRSRSMLRSRKGNSIIERKKGEPEHISRYWSSFSFCFPPLWCIVCSDI